jgi:hypothetical protein
MVVEIISEPSEGASDQPLREMRPMRLGEQVFIHIIGTRNSITFVLQVSTTICQRISKAAELQLSRDLSDRSGISLVQHLGIDSFSLKSMHILL